MADELLMTYTVLDGAYQDGKLRRIEGEKGSPDQIHNPADTGYPLDPQDDGDPMVYSYMSTDTSGKEEPHILLVRTVSWSPGDTTYTVLKPVLGNTWAVYNNRENIKFTLNGDVVLGNPQSLGQVKIGNNRFIYLVEYDSGRVYGIDVGLFEAASGTSYALNPALSVVGIDPPSGFTSHGVSIVGLEETDAHSLFALYMTVDDPWATAPNYQQSTLVKLFVNDTAGTDNPVGKPSVNSSVLVGRNATGLVPVGSGSSLSFLVPAIGGPQNYGANNGLSSDLYRVPVSLTGITIPLVGGSRSSDLTSSDTYDIKMVAASSDGSVIYVLTGCYSSSYDTFWRLYKLSLSDLGGNRVPLNNQTIASKAVDSASGAEGYYWSVLYENSAGANGRLWFLKGSPIQITVGTSYPASIPPASDYKYIETGEPLGGANVNSADLTGEMVAQAKTDKFVSTLLRGYQPPHVVSGAFRSMADFIRYEKARKLHKERLEKERAGKSGEQN